MQGGDGQFPEFIGVFCRLVQSAGQQFSASDPREGLQCFRRIPAHATELRHFGGGSVDVALRNGVLHIRDEDTGDLCPHNRDGKGRAQNGRRAFALLYAQCFQIFAEGLAQIVAIQAQIPQSLSGSRACRRHRSACLRISSRKSDGCEAYTSKRRSIESRRRCPALWIRCNGKSQASEYSAR